MAGTGKRADQIKTLIWKDTKYFGKYGFKIKGVKEVINAVNIDHIEENLEKFLSNGLISKEGDKYIIDLKKLGCNKLLGNGIVTKKFKVTAKYASGNAVEKVKNAGGEVVLESVKEVKSSE